jgi:hypothetical protein
MRSTAVQALATHNQRPIGRSSFFHAKRPCTGILVLTGLGACLERTGRLATRCSRKCWTRMPCACTCWDVYMEYRNSECSVLMISSTKGNMKTVSPTDSVYGGILNCAAKICKLL